MPRRLLVALLMLVAAPLVLLGWLSASAHQQQQRQARDQLSRFFQSRLAEIDRSLLDVFDAYERELRSALEDRSDMAAAIRELELDSPIVRSGIYVNKTGFLLHPPQPQPEQAEKVALFAALPAIVRSRPDLGPIPADPQKSLPPTVVPKGRSQSAQVVQPAYQAPRIVGEGKWQVWYMDEGVQLIYWMQLSDGSAVGFLLERVRWIADLTSKLPDTTIDPITADQESPPAAAGFTTLSDEARQLVYRWGDDKGPREEQPLAVRGLSPPLSSWRLEYHSRDPLAGAPSTLFLVASIAGVGVMILSLGIYVMTAVQRQMHSARQRVSFASQVSHELRTPLTNIRLYAELAENDLTRLPEGETRESVGRRLHVIDTESRRLGRLVSGVLEMIRDPRKQRQPRIAPVVADEVIEHTLTQFAPSFEMSQLRVQRSANAPNQVGIDADILELILVNLLSNVEKYASHGGSVTVRSRMDDDRLTVEIFDQGPGIPWHERHRIFRPFVRLDDSIQAPSGTGIGLTIARKLAQRHGGDLRLIQDADHSGACFQLQIQSSSMSHSSDGVALG